MTLTDTSGAGLALLEDGLPLVGRAQTGDWATTLFASRDGAVSKEFGGTWVSDHDIVAAPGKPISGGFTLRAVAAGRGETVALSANTDKKGEHRQEGRTQTRRANTDKKGEHKGRPYGLRAILKGNLA